MHLHFVLAFTRQTVLLRLQIPIVQDLKMQSLGFNSPLLTGNVVQEI